MQDLTAMLLRTRRTSIPEEAEALSGTATNVSTLEPAPGCSRWWVQLAPIARPQTSQTSGLRHREGEGAG